MKFMIKFKTKAETENHICSKCSKEIISVSNYIRVVVNDGVERLHKFCPNF